MRSSGLQSGLLFLERCRLLLFVRYIMVDLRCISVHRLHRLLIRTSTLSYRCCRHTCIVQKEKEKILRLNILSVPEWLQSSSKNIGIEFLWYRKQSWAHSHPWNHANTNKRKSSNYQRHLHYNWDTFQLYTNSSFHSSLPWIHRLLWSPRKWFIIKLFRKQHRRWTVHYLVYQFDEILWHQSRSSPSVQWDDHLCNLFSSLEVDLDHISIIWSHVLVRENLTGQDLIYHPF